MSGRPGERSPRWAAKVLELRSVRTIHRWCKEGRLEYRRRDAGGRWWVLEDEILAMRRASEPLVGLAYDL